MSTSTFLENYLTILSWTPTNNKGKLSSHLFQPLNRKDSKNDWNRIRSGTWRRSRTKHYKSSPQGPGNSLSTQGVIAHGAGGSAGGATGFSTICPTVTSFATFSGMPGGPPSATITLPLCLMPDSFNGSGDLEDCLQKFNRAAMLAGRLSPRHNHRPQHFALRLRDNALHFYTTLSPEQQAHH